MKGSLADIELCSKVELI